MNPPPGVAILGLGYLGLPLAEALHRRGHPLLAARRSVPPQALPFALQTVDIGHAAAHDWSAWAAYPIWVCLLPPSGSEDAAALFDRALLYTAITRARNHFVFWGEPAQLQAAIARNSPRRSGLRLALAHCAAQAPSL